MTDIYKLKLHESMSVINGNWVEYIVTRVPGGWIYAHIRLDCQAMSSVFVPFDNEFQGGGDEK